MGLYNLDNNQLDATSYCNFVIAAPIFKGNTEEIIAVITFDSEVKVDQPTNNDWQSIIRDYCKIVHKHHELLKS